MIKRIGLFILVNMAIMLTVNIVLNLLGVRPYLTARGMDYSSLMAFCLVWGMVGSFIQLQFSKTFAKMSFGLQTISSENAYGEQRWLYDTVARLAKEAGLKKMPELAYFDSPEANAFATGPSRSNSLVAVSTGLLQKMNHREVEAVLAHEVSHIANGDMVTMTLIQGVVNAFVLFFAKAVAWAIANGSRSSDEEGNGGFSYMTYFLVEILAQIVFGILGSLIVCWFSRWREFRADRGAAGLVGASAMVSALSRLKNDLEVVDPALENTAVASLKISGKKNFMLLFSTHPSLDQRIATLNAM